MKKLLLLFVAAVCPLISAHAQYDFSHKFFVSVQGGELISFCEDYNTYFDNANGKDLFNPFGEVAVGYDFTNTIGVRLAVEYSNNAGACNWHETSALDFYPYDFKSISAFADVTMSLAGLRDTFGNFNPRLYLGLGYAHTYDMTDAGHPWQSASDPNNVFAFRLGSIIEYCFCEHFGVFADLNVEFYTDKFNGIAPARSESRGNQRGPAASPFDVRPTASLGVAYHF